LQLSGRAIARTGHYRVFMLAGAVALTTGLVLMGTIDETTSLVEVAAFMFVLGAGILVTVFNAVRSTKKGVIAGPDPWKANTLEWFTSSPPPVNNFDIIPRVRSVEPMKDIRRQVERQVGQTSSSPAPAPESTIQA